MLASLYNGSVCVWNHETQVMLLVFLYYEIFITNRCINSVFRCKIHQKNLKSLPLIDGLIAKVTVVLDKGYL